MTQPYQIVGLTGSLRKASVNKLLLGSAAALLPEDFHYTFADLGNIPLYNQDLETELPETVVQFAELCRRADGILISEPEFNGLISGVLKNALDWVSRPCVQTPLALKPIAIMGATPGVSGTSRAQTNLRQLLFALNMEPVNRPEFKLSQAPSKFNEDGQLSDAFSLQLLQQLMDNFSAKVRLHRPKA